MFQHLLGLFYPNLCLCCGENLYAHEEYICTKCLCDIPRTNLHLQPDNQIEQRFWGKVPVEKATSFFYFGKGSKYQHLLHKLKYKGHKEIGEVLGRYAASDLLESGIFNNIDIIIPVPLHPKKLQKRGYNQSEYIARGLSKVLNKPYDTVHLYRARENTTQTKKSVFERYQNTLGIFAIHQPEDLAGKHILVVDDVLTTGSTLENCINELLKIPNVKASIFTLAVT